MPLHLVTGHKGEAHISTADVGAFNAGIFGQGEYVLNTGQKFRIEVLSNNAVKIYDGDLVMQGRHISLKSGSSEELTIDNGAADLNRIDLVVVRYTQDISTGIENAEFAVIKGIPAVEAVAPEYTTGDILSGGCVLHEMPLYKIPISGLAIGEPEQLFVVTEKVSKEGDTMTGTLKLKRMFGETAETGGLFPSAYAIGEDRSFAITRMVNDAVESMLFFNRYGLGLLDAANEDYSYFSRAVLGTYSGDGNESKFIDLGFTPSAVLITRRDGITAYTHGDAKEFYEFYGGIALNNFPCASGGYNIINIENGGFRVYKTTIESGRLVHTNTTDTFHYIAYR